MDELDPRQAPVVTTTLGDQRARERLLRAAADVFDRKGYAAASVREIVERAGITKPVLYYHFGSKEGMLNAILDEGERLMREAVARALRQEGSVRARVTALCEGIYQLFRENVSAVRVAHALYFGPRESFPAFDWCRFERLLLPAVRDLVQQGMAAGEIRDAGPEDVMLAMNGAISGCTDLALRRDAGQVGPETIRNVIDLIFDGLSARAEKEN